ncbi:MAG: addiction module toxin, HicA family [Candidatus Omnitrophota bacterium]|jgi:predicted RNA binding protein YcfA (HicA-like mRNA interferase family)|nr:MAG: addiction module toxin, HicA family [Candidatus Omnitrophota bacterium]
MPKLPSISGKELIKLLTTIGFQSLRTRGSHVRLFAADGRKTSVPIHTGKTIPKGLLRKIIREDLELKLEEFMQIYDAFRNN